MSKELENYLLKAEGGGYAFTEKEYNAQIAASGGIKAKKPTNEEPHMPKGEPGGMGHEQGGNLEGLGKQSDPSQSKVSAGDTSGAGTKTENLMPQGTTSFGQPTNGGVLKRSMTEAELVEEATKESVHFEAGDGVCFSYSTREDHILSKAMGPKAGFEPAPIEQAPLNGAPLFTKEPCGGCGLAKSMVFRNCPNCGHRD